MRGDGLWPPGVGTGVLCHANEVPFFNVAIANFRASFMAACRSGDTVHATWLYVHSPSTGRASQGWSSPLFLRLEGLKV
jgi:hypothetical protein